MGAQINCEPGYTGQFCESPICYDPITPNPIDESAPRLIDIFYNRQSCMGNVTFPLDSESNQLLIHVYTNEGELNGNVTLINDQGATIPANAGSGGSSWFWYNPSPGQYEVFVAVGSSNINYCDVEISTLSRLAADVGFVKRPQEEVFIQGLAYNTQQYVVVHPYFLIPPATVSAIYIYENQRDHTRYVQRLQSRCGCGYEYYAGEFTCDANILSYRWVVEGIDFKGYLWRRAGKFDCAAVLGPSKTPPATQQPPKYCMNDGILITQPDGTTFCYCKEFFTGTMCENALCMNGGTPTMDQQVCLCPVGYTGKWCEHVICQFDNINQDYFTEQKTLIVAVRKSTAIMQQVSAIANAIDFVKNGYWATTNVYSNYIMVQFGGNDAIPHFYYATDYSTFLSQLNATSSGTPWSNACSDDVILGITQVFEQLVIYHKSPIYVFTDVPPNDNTNFMDIYMPNQFRKLPIYTFFLIDNSTQCQPDTNSISYQTLQDISIVSGGLMLTPNKNNYANAFQNILLRTTYRANYITFNEMNRCSMGNRQSFIVDQSAEVVTIIATGVDLYLTITDPNWVVLNESQLAKKYDDGYTYIWDILDHTPGEYLYLLQGLAGSGLPCSFRVIARSNYDLFLGASEGLLADMSLPDPVYNYPSNMVVHINGIRGRVQDQFRLFAEMQIDSWNRNQLFNQPVYYSSGIYRDGCTFHLYFGEFTCTTADQRFIVTVFADDEFGLPIQRSWPAYCVQLPPQNATIPPNGNCYNGGVPDPNNATNCICTPNWTGSNCTTIVCRNNGTSSGDTCVCAAQTTGQFCEVVMCDNKAMNVNFEPNNRALVFILNTRNTMANTLQDIANQGANLVRDLFMADGGWISHYVVATYDELGGGVVNVYRADKYKLFIDDLQTTVNVAKQGPYTDSSNCTGMISDAIYDVVTKLRALGLPNSYAYIFTDSDFSAQLSIVDAQALMGAQDIFLTLNFIVTNYSLCGAPNGGQNGPSELMQQMARDTAGLIYYTKNAGSFLNVVPTYYRSGIIAAGYSDDCNRNPITYYLPVDGWSQSFVVTATGPGVSIGMQPPVNAEISNFAELVNNVDQDDYLHVVQYVVPCDASNAAVKDRGQYCYILHTSLEQLSWYEARDRCRQDEAYLVDIRSADVQGFFSVETTGTPTWIGLYRLPGTNQWFWDNYRGVNLTYNSNTDYSYWAPGEPSNAGDCVVSKPAENDTRWYMAPCDSTYYYMCQKHKYGQTIMPHDPDANRLPAGLWKMTVSSNATGTNASCFFEARIQSEVQVYWGYVPGVHNDTPTTYGNLLSNANYYIAHTTGLQPLNIDNVLNQIDGHLDYALIHRMNGSLYSTVSFEQRDDLFCTYERVSQPFPCPGYKETQAKTNYYVKFSGIDQYGNLFERYAATYCTATAHCVNGWLSNGVCVCAPYWEGATCSTPICQNGGVVNGQQCSCPATNNFVGPHCEYPNCQDPDRITFNDTGITLAILLETSAKTGSAIWYLRNNLEKIINQVTQDNVTSSKWISNYILYPFDSNANRDAWYPKVSSNNFADINAQLQNIAINKCPGNDSYICETGGNCPRPIFTVLGETLADPTFKSPNSVVLIITASNANDYPLVGDVQDFAQVLRATVNVIVVDSAAPCGNYSFNMPETFTMFQLAQYTGGDFIFTTAKQLVSDLLPYYLPTLYRTAHLGSVVVRNCTDDVLYFPIDAGTQAFSFSYTGAGAGNIQLTLTDSTGTVVPFPEGYQLYDYTYFGFFDYLNQMSNSPGTWKLELKSQTQNCVLTVRLRSSIEVYVGFTNQTETNLVQDALQDRPRALMATGEIPNGIIIHAENLGTGSLSYVQIHGPRGDSVYYTSELVRRQGCNYQYWAVTPYRCSPGIYVVSVYGVDSKGQQFLRNFPIQCTSYRPPTPPQPRCDTTELMFDIVLMVDITKASLKYGNNTWPDFKTALSRAFYNYHGDGSTFNIGGTRLAIIGVAGENTTQLFNDFTASENKKITDLLIPVQQVNDYGIYLPAAISLAQQLYTDPAHGYRNKTSYPDVRHLVIYATINGAFNGGEPADDVHNLIESGAFGFAVVGANNTYWDDSYRYNLETLTSGFCLYYAIDSPQETYIPYYINDLTCSRRAMCGDASGNETNFGFLNELDYKVKHLMARDMPLSNFMSFFS